jgi:phosphotransferase system, enzyme I, PtsP
MTSWQQQLNIFNTHNTLPEIVKELSHSIQKKLDVDACSIFTLEKDNIYNLDATTLTPLLGGLIHINIDSDAVGSIVKRKEALLIKNLYKDKNRPNTILQSFTKQKLYTFFGVPIIYKSSVIGVVIIQTAKVNAINESTQAALVTLCTNISEPFETALGKEEVEEKIEVAAPKNEMVSFDGKGLTTGATIGKAIARYNIFDIDSIPDKKNQSDDEVTEFKEAVKIVKKDLMEMAKTIESLATKEESALFTAYAQIIMSNRFYHAIIEQIGSDVWVQTAIKKVVKKQVAVFQDMDDPYLRERASDLRDIAKRILLQLQKKTPAKRNYPSNTILVAQEITPSMFADVPKGRLKAIVSERGTENSHVAILARAIGIPFVIGVQSLPISYLDGKEIIVDAYVGKIYVTPGKGLIKAYQRLLKREEEMLSQLKDTVLLPCFTADDKPITLQANVGLVADLDIALENNAQGIGLYRTEIPFMIREKFPSEEEQRIIYNQFLHAFPDQTVTLRTLDIGADKSLPYFYVKEDNPALGWRGIRMMLDQQDLFLTQIRAMLRASEKYHNLKILLPMITEVDEITITTTLVQRAHQQLLEEGFTIQMPKIGVMVEVPSIIYQLPAVLKLVDFISVGSNDLTQYLLAIDRNNQKVAAQYDQLHPAVIQALQHINQLVGDTYEDISICGEMASNPLAIPLLVGMGFTTLSMNAINILKAKWIIKHLSYTQCQKLAQHILTLTNKEEIHQHLSDFLIENELGGMIRVGNR